jgi:heme/copper-type cytochrome/quinol oxidase subunit 2
MVRLIVTKFWPAFIPLLLYVLWMIYLYRRAKKTGEPSPPWMRGNSWWLTIGATLIIAALCFVSLGLLMPANDGTGYTPTQMRDGTIIKGGFD